jgi:hypothetical protein
LRNWRRWESRLRATGLFPAKEPQIATMLALLEDPARGLFLSIAGVATIAWA